MMQFGPWQSWPNSILGEWSAASKSNFVQSLQTGSITLTERARKKEATAGGEMISSFFRIMHQHRTPSEAVFWLRDALQYLSRLPPVQILTYSQPTFFFALKGTSFKWEGNYPLHNSDQGKIGVQRCLVAKEEYSEGKRNWTKALVLTFNDHASYMFVDLFSVYTTCL